MTKPEQPVSPPIETLDEELTLVVRKQLWIGVTITLALALVFTLFFMDHSGWVVVAIVLLISSKKAILQYKVLGARKAEIMEELRAA